MSGEYELRVINKPLFYVELIALLNRLVNDKGYRGIQFSKEQSVFLHQLNCLRLKGYELFEFYLYNSIEDIEMLETVYKSYNQTDFLYLLCGEVFSKEEILLLVKNFDSIGSLVDGNSYISDHDWQSIRFVFNNTQEFINRLIDLLKSLHIVVLEQLENQTIYQKSIAKVSADLKSKVPLDVAQGIMGKKFKRVYDFKTYYFVPSYFFYNKPMRTFNDNTQIVIYPIQEFNLYDKTMLANALRIIGDNTRLDIIERLSKKPMFGKELAKELGIGTSTVSHHLEQLRSIGLIHEERDKNTKYFGINLIEYNKFCDALKSFIQ